MAKSFEVLRGQMSLKAQLRAKQEAARMLEEIRRQQSQSKPRRSDVENS